MKKEEPKSIGEILSCFMQVKDIQVAAAEGSARETWCKIVGSYIAESTRDVFVKDGILTVSFTKSTVKTEVMMHRKDYIQAMNKELGAEIVRTMKFL